MNESNILILVAGLLFLAVAFGVVRLLRFAGQRNFDVHLGGGLICVGLFQLVLSGGWASLSNLAVTAALFAGVLLAALMKIERGLEQRVWLHQASTQEWAEAERELQRQRDALARANEEWPRAYAELEKASSALEAAATEAKVRAIELARINNQLKADNERLVAENERLGIATEQLLQIVAALDEDVFEQKRLRKEIEHLRPEILTVSPAPVSSPVMASNGSTDLSCDVGRRLDEVGVSLGRIAEHLAESRGANICRIARLLREHARNLNAFLTRDPRGKKFPEMLVSLAQQVSDEHALLTRKISAMRRQLELIRTAAGDPQGGGRLKTSGDSDASSGYTLSAVATETGTMSAESPAPAEAAEVSELASPESLRPT